MVPLNPTSARGCGVSGVGVAAITPLSLPPSLEGPGWDVVVQQVSPCGCSVQGPESALLNLPTPVWG